MVPYRYGQRSTDHRKITEESKRKMNNCKREPIFNFIPVDHVIIDTPSFFENYRCSHRESCTRIAYT